MSAYKISKRTYRNCGCVSDYVNSRSELLGYCPKHGTDRTRVYAIPKPANERKLDTGWQSIAEDDGKFID